MSVVGSPICLPMAEHQPGLEVPFSDLPEVYIREQEPLYVCSSPSNQEEVIHPIVGSDAIKVGNAIKSSKQKICGLDRRYFWWSIAMFGALTIIIGAIVGGTVGGVLGRQRQTSINYNDNPYASLPTHLLT